MVLAADQLSVIEEIIELNPELLVDAAELIEIIAREVYGPASQEEIDAQLDRLLLEAVIPGRTIDIAPSAIVGEGETVDLNGTVIATVIANQGTITDTEGRFGDNLFGSVIFNGGDIDLDPGEDLIIALGGGITNIGTISTGGQLDLVSGTDLGNNDVEGLDNFGGLIDTGNGADRLVGNAVGIIDALGIDNDFGGVIKTGRGADLIDGEGQAIDLAFGIVNADFSVIETSTGNDVVFGVADDFLAFADFGFMAGINNNFGSVIDTGANDDLVEGVAFADDADSFGGTVYGIANLDAEISTRGGNDRLIGEAITFGFQDETSGIANEGYGPDDRSLIDLGSGDDFVLGFAQSWGESLFTNGIELKSSDLVSKSGNNLIEGEALGGIVASGIFLDSDSAIKLGGGNDIVAGFAFNGLESNEGITNWGKISTGAGDDVVESLFGDFGGEGATNLGRGDDLIVGFGTGNFNGGAGTDIIKLTTGVYRFEDNTLTREEDGVSMGLRRVEGLSGIADEESLLLVDGATYVVGENNSALFF